MNQSTPRKEISVSTYSVFFEMFSKDHNKHSPNTQQKSHVHNVFYFFQIFVVRTTTPDGRQ
jgi:hypothetical protein